MAAALPTTRPLGPARTVSRPPSPAWQDSAPGRTAGRRTPPATAYLRGASPDPRVRPAPQPSGARAHLARPRPDAQAPQEISAQAGPGGGQSHLAAVPADLRR